MNTLNAVEYLIRVSKATSREEYDRVKADFIERHSRLHDATKQRMWPTAPENDPTPELTKKVNAATRETLKQQLDVMHREVMAIVEEGEGVFRARNDFFLRVQKSLEIAMRTDKKNGLSDLQLNQLVYQVDIQLPPKDFVPAE